MRRVTEILNDMVTGFIADDALTRAAGIAFFTLFSLGPLLFIATGVAGLFFGESEVNLAIEQQAAAMLGPEAARTVSEMAQGALGEARGAMAVLIGVVILIITASGVFGALQTALNAVWKVEMPVQVGASAVLTSFLKAKAAALGLVAATGFLLLVSLVASAVGAAFGAWLTRQSTALEAMVHLIDFVVSLAVITLLFAAIYKILPDRKLAWRDVFIGALSTALLFTLGKTLIGFYIGSVGVAKGFGAAGTLVVILLWIYYSAVIFLLGAEFTRAWSGKEAAKPEDVVAAPPGEGVHRPAALAAVARDASAGQGALLLALSAGLGLLLLARLLRPRPLPNVKGYVP